MNATRVGRRFTGRRLLTSTAMVIALAAAASAQETMTLEDAIARAIRESARIAELDARQAGAAAAEAGRRAAGLPIVSLQGGYVRTSHVEEYALALPGQPLRVLYPDVPDNLRGRLDVQWPVYSGGRLEALARAARAEKDALGGDRAALEADVRLEVTRVYWTLVTAVDTERVVARSVERMDAHVRDLRVRLEQGLISPSDVTSAEAQRARQQLLAIEARNLRQIAEADLRRLTGSTAPAQTGSGPLRDKPLGDNDLSEFQNKKTEPPATRGSGPERAGLERRVAAAEAREEAARAGDRPQVAVIAGYDYARPHPRIFPRAARWDDFWEAGVNVSWTLWDGGRRGAEKAEAAAATRAAQARIAEFDRTRAFELEQRQLEADSARAAIAAAAEGIRSATETLRVIGERYKQGVATSTDVLDAEVALLQAELDRTRAINAARIADARLERARAR